VTWNVAMTRSYSTRSSGALYNDVFEGAPTGVSSSSNDFGDLLGGFKTSGSRPQPSQNSFSDDLLGGYSASKPSQATAHASSSSLDDIFSGGLGQTRTSSHNSFSAKNYDDDPFSSFGMPKPEPKVTQSQTLFDDDWNFGASKPKPASRGSTLHASMDGDLLGGFSTSGGRSKQATPFRSPPSSPPRANHSEPVFDEFLPGFGGGDQGKRTAVPDADAMRGIPIISTDDDDVFSSIPSSTSAATPDPFRGIPGTRSGGEGDASRGIPPVTPLDADEMRGIPPVSSSPIVDDDPFSSAAEVDPFANIIADSIPPPAASHADPLDPFDMSPASVPSSNGATEESGAQVSNGGGSPDSFDGFPHPSPLATSKAKEESTPSRSGSGSDGREGSQGSGTWDDKPSRRGFGSVPLNVDLNEVPDVASPTYPSGTYDVRTGRESHGFAPKFDDEPKFDEPSMPGDERSNSSRHDTDKVPIDIFEENWLTVDDLKLVTVPSATRPPSRAPPRPGFDKRRSSRRAASQRDSVGERSAGERSRGRSDELPVYKDSRPNGLDASKEDELARERAAAREREAALVQKERDAAERERAARQRDRAERAERQRERERQMDRLREQETPRNAEPARERADTRNEVPNARDDEAAERAKKAAERAAKEAQHRMEKAAAERAIAEARERAERAARERAERVAKERVAAAREKEQREREEREKREREERARRERAKEERERERERREREERERREKEDREKERERDRERDRRRERERGAAEQPRPTSASSRATSEPRQRPATNQPAPSGGDVRRPSPGNPVYSSTGSSPMPTPAPRNPQPSMKAVDDWTTLLTQTAPSGDEFQEIPGETAERRKLRMERHQKTIERAQQALKEKNDRDKALAMEQAERSRASGNLDAEIRRWATGKEGNLRALLSSLHLVLWPEANWKPLSLTDLITGISVKKAYQRAILCVHPDKVQQKGATVQQKYIAEKVFDLLKEAFAKFNSSELY
jgi:hypothetical protein